jgi:hypothetical protein
MGGRVIGEALAVLAVLGGLVGVGLGLAVAIIMMKALCDGTLVPDRAEKWDHRHFLFPVMFTAAGGRGDGVVTRFTRTGSTSWLIGPAITGPTNHDVSRQRWVRLCRRSEAETSARLSHRLVPAGRTSGS